MRFGLSFLLLLAAPLFAADLALPPLFSDHMVLQHGVKVPVWGTAAPGETVTVTLAARNAEAKAAAGADGKWKVELGPLEAGGPFELTVTAGKTLTLKDVLVGEVWLCSGQSNMAFQVKSALNAAQDVEKADFPMLRHFTVPSKAEDKPQETCGGAWVACTPQAVGAFTAVGYFFGRELHQELKVPIGLIHSSVGGTPAEAWTSKEALQGEADLKAIFERYEKQIASFPKSKEDFPKVLEKWQQDAEKAKADGKPEPKKPAPPADPAASKQRPAGLYNAMIAPLIPYAVRGAIWYQGEANAARAVQYRQLFPTMIRDWRARWGHEFPFLWVQLANFMARKDDPNAPSGWAELREAQTMTLALPKTGMGLAIDIGEEKDIHPKNKQEAGHRLALNALALVYGKELPYSGPQFESLVFEGATLRVKFKHLFGGLEARGGALKGFAVAGPDKKYVWADARIEGESVVAGAAAVKQPVAIRYAWGDNPEATLYNKAGLPAIPFRAGESDAAP